MKNSKQNILQKRTPYNANIKNGKAAYLVAREKSCFIPINSNNDKP